MTELEHTRYMRDLRRQMVALFSLGELSTLAFDLSVDWDSLEGGEIISKVQSLILYLARRGRLNDLITLLREGRPGANWPEVPSSGQQKKDENEITPASVREATLQDYLRTMRSLLIHEASEKHRYSERTLAYFRELTDAVMLRLDKPRLGIVIRFLGSKDLASTITAKEMDFTGVNFIGVNLRGIGLNRARLHSARFFQANLRNADLSEANCTNADLSLADLTEANLFGAILDHADLSETILDNADLSGAQLIGANLARASLQGANLRRATLREANLDRAVLDNANLVGADLEKAYLPFATLCKANLKGTNLNHAHLGDTDLYMAQLQRAHLANADLGGTKLRKAILTEAKLYGADLSDSSLSDADLSGADLTGADLMRSDLTEAALVGTDLTAANLDGATGWTLDQLERAFIYNTTMPDGLYVGHVAPSLVDDKPTKRGYSFDEWKAQCDSAL